MHLMETYLPTSVPCPIEGNSIIEVSARIVITSLLKALSLVQSCLSLVARQLPTSVKRCNNNRFIVKFLINHALLFNNRFIMFTLKFFLEVVYYLPLLTQRGNNSHSVCISHLHTLLIYSRSSQCKKQNYTKLA